MCTTDSNASFSYRWKDRLTITPVKEVTTFPGIGEDFDGVFILAGPAAAKWQYQQE
jgi:hypothetical protein